MSLQGLRYTARLKKLIDCQKFCVDINCGLARLRELTAKRMRQLFVRIPSITSLGDSGFYVTAYLETNLTIIHNHRSAHSFGEGEDNSVRCRGDNK